MSTIVRREFRGMCLAVANSNRKSEKKRQNR